MTKPPYRVPSMQEIRELEPNGFNVVSLFAGGGGSSTGYRMAGFKVLYANEFIPAAADTYRANAREGTIVDETDVRQLTGHQILDRIGLLPGELDLLDGSPPCASFSTAGKTSKKWGKVSAYSDSAQRTDDLFYEYIRILREIRPKVFVAENVSGLVKGVSKGYFKTILAEFQKAGYRVTARLLDASWLGVPQARQRIIFVGVREDLGLEPVHPKPFQYRYTVRDALPWISHQGDNGGFGGGAWQGTDRPSPTIGAGPSTGNGRFPPSVVVVHDTLGQPQYSQGDITDKPATTVMTNSRHFRVIHARGISWEGAGDITDQPSPTITVGVGSVNSYHYQVHSSDPAGLDCTDPETGQNLKLPPGSVLLQQSGQARKLTLGELRSICSFPPDYELTGSYANRWERMGRSVPPLMMKAIAETIRDQVLVPLQLRETISAG